MFCKQYGAPIAETATVCAACSTTTGTANPTAAVTNKVKAASKDSLQAFLKFATDPVAGLSVAYESLADMQARAISRLRLEWQMMSRGIVSYASTAKRNIHAELKHGRA
jgi:hypothetical protein